MVEERSIAPTLRKIGESVEQGEVGVFEPGHGYKHHLNVTKNALGIARNEGVEVDINVLLVAGCLHDFEQRGGVKSEELDKYMRDELGLSGEFVSKVVDAVGNHSLDDTPQTVEGELIWVADKANYPNVERFESVVDYVKSLPTDDERNATIKHYYDSLAEKWVRGTVEIPQNKLMEKYPTALKLFQKRLDETVKFIKVEGNEVFDGWLKLYEDAHDKLEKQ